MNKLWTKTKHINMLEELEKFETADDLVYDNMLTVPDIYGSAAHAKMLRAIGVLREAELKSILSALSNILQQFHKNTFDLVLGDEDIHTKIENELVKLVGEAGKKIHTGRSRNDQVLVDLRILSKEKIFEIKEQLLILIQLFANRAEKWKHIPMPGYTHMQKAMPSSVGLWLGAYAESLTDNVRILETAFDLIDQSPLGSGAGYGVTLPIDREMTAQLLGFGKVQNNSLYCQNSRGKLESTVLFALLNITTDIARFASDMLLFTTAEFNFFTVSESICTGSSIMPQKRNVDIAELLRSKAHTMFGYFTQVYSISLSLPSGYNRDLQDTKKPYIESFESTSRVLAIAQMLLTNIKPNTKVLAACMTKELYATSLAYKYVVEKDMPFRVAYQSVAEHLEDIPNFDIQQELKKSTHSGSTGNLGLKKLNIFTKQELKKLTKRKYIWKQTLSSLLKV